MATKTKTTAKKAAKKTTTSKAAKKVTKKAAVKKVTPKAKEVKAFVSSVHLINGTVVTIESQNAPDVEKLLADNVITVPGNPQTYIKTSNVATVQVAQK